MTTILIVDDHPLVRSALMQQVTSLLPFANVLSAGNAEQARCAVELTPAPDLILLDINLPDVDGLNLLKEWQKSVPVIVVTGEIDVSQAVENAGATAFVPKSASEFSLREAIVQALGLASADGATGVLRPALETLTPRQQEVLRALVAGKSNLDIANHLDISENTVRVHLTAIFKALGVVSRTQAVLSARAAGW